MSFPKRKAPHNVRVLREWVREYADSTDQVVGRVTRAVSFMLVTLALERARAEDESPLFLVKGGVSMELRLNLQARTTKDLDTVFRGRFDEWLEALDDALDSNAGDLSFSRSEPAAIPDSRAYRVDVAIDLKGKRWGQVQLEVAPAEAAEVLDIDEVEPFDIGRFGLPRPGHVKVVGLAYLIAQKLHACTDPPDEGEENRRVHDLVDLLLARDLLDPENLERVHEACQAIFAGRETHSWPPALVVYPSWPASFAKLAAEEGFPIDDVERAASLVREFVAEIDRARN
jgi:hypothetical protein